jgi:hypothetical protein
MGGAGRGRGRGRGMDGFGGDWPPGPGGGGGNRFDGTTYVIPADKCGLVIGKGTILLLIASASCVNNNHSLG